MKAYWLKVHGVRMGWCLVWGEGRGYGAKAYELKVYEGGNGVKVYGVGMG